jgi:uncharacterized hydrophobic protein (TIGR00271 family)
MKDTVRTTIRSGAVISAPYLLMNTLAAVIACYGLFANSPAVVIGAMIVAMLLGPITGVALALVDSDMRGLGQALGALLGGVVCMMVAAFILGIIHHDIPITNEILARTAPNLLDLMIALAGGAAGAYATVSPRLSAAFVGVAIATALVPPLSAASILCARGAYDLARGAFLLAFSNMVAIQFASSAVLWLMGFRRFTQTSGLALVTFLRRNLVSVAILAALAFLLATNLQQVIAKQLFEIRVRGTLRQAVNASAGSYLADVRFATTKTTTIVRAVVRGPNPPSADQVAALEARLPPPPDHTRIALRIRFVDTTIITRDGSLYDDVEFGMKE